MFLFLDNAHIALARTTCHSRNHLKRGISPFYTGGDVLPFVVLIQPHIKMLDFIY